MFNQNKQEDMFETKKSTALYRSFLSEAWRLTWQRKRLWIFGIFASLISTGGVIDITFQSLNRAQKTGSILTQLMDNAFIGYSIASQYIQQLQAIGNYKIMMFIVFATLVGIALVVMATLSQSAIILGLKTKNHRVSRELRREASKHFLPLLLIAIINKLALGMLMVLISLSMMLISLSYSGKDTLFFFILMLILIPAVIIVSIIYMLSIINVVNNDKQALPAILTALCIFKRHWLATLEFGVLLFLITLGAGLIMLCLIVVLTIPYSIILATTMLTGSLYFYLTLYVVLFLVVLTIMFTFIGMIVTFQYSSWYLFFKRSNHPIHGGHVISKTLRLANSCRKKHLLVL